MKMLNIEGGDVWKDSTVNWQSIGCAFLYWLVASNIEQCSNQIARISLSDLTKLCGIWVKSLNKIKRPRLLPRDFTCLNHDRESLCLGNGNGSAVAPPRAIEASVSWICCDFDSRASHQGVLMRFMEEKQVCQLVLTNPPVSSSSIHLSWSYAVSDGWFCPLTACTVSLTSRTVSSTIFAVDRSFLIHPKQSQPQLELSTPWMSLGHTQFLLCRRQCGDLARATVPCPF